MRPVSAILAILFAMGLAVLVAQPALAQTFTVLHSFTGGADGNFPQTGAVDGAGNFYGTTAAGGQQNQNCQNLQCGIVFKLSQKNSNWVLTPIYSFQGGNDGWMPNPGPIFGPDGALYGTTAFGGTQSCQRPGCGTVYKLQPPPSRCTSTLCEWQETVLHSFPGFRGDGIYPSGGVTFDTAGNMYGPTTFGGCPSGNNQCGVIYKLTHSGSGWTESVAYAFLGTFSGGEPFAPVVFDTAGNMYGAEQDGGNYGSIYQLSPSGSGWSFNIIYQFQQDSVGDEPNGLLYYAGSLYGMTAGGGVNGGGIAYQLTFAGGQWTLNTLESFSYSDAEQLMQSPMVADAQGNLYGARGNGGQYGWGTVFKLTPSGGGWTYTSLHDFAEGSDGAIPTSVVVDAQGNVYGTTWRGGVYNDGVAFKISQ